MRARIWMALVVVTTLAGANPAIANLPRERVDVLVSPIIEAGDCKGIVVGLIDETGRRDVFGYGVTATNGGTRPDGRTIFEIGSVTKVFTAILLAEMVEAGDVKLGQPVSELLPVDVELPAGVDGTPITLAHLASQTSGLPRMPDNFYPADDANPYIDYTPARLYEGLAAIKLTRNPGEEYDYSNLGVGLLGHALARKAGKEYETLLSERILRPLKLDDTRITLNAAARKRFAQGHHAIGDEVPGWDFSSLDGAGALRSTVDDQLTFLAANMELTEAPAVLRAAMRMTYEKRANVDNRTDIGLGWHIGKRTGARYHDGQTAGYHSFVAFIRGKKIGVVVLGNTGTGVISTLGTQLIQASLGEHVEPLPQYQATKPTK